MKKLTTLLLILLCTSIMAWAEGWNAETIQMVHLQDSTKYVCNPDNVLTQAEVAQIDSMLHKLRLAKGIESVVVVVKKIEGGDLYTFGSELYNKYGIGNKKQRTGLLVTLSTGDRDVRIQPAYGLEGTLPDARCGRILDANIENLQNSKWGPAMVGIISTLCDEIYKDDSIQKDTSTEAEDDDTMYVYIGIAVFVLFFIIIFNYSPKRKCPKCKKRAMVITGSKTLSKDSRYKTVEYTYTCKKCNHTEKVVRKNSINSGGGGAAAGAAGGMLGGFGGGSHSSGGSFGGGSYGGGGAGRHF